MINLKNIKVSGRYATALFQVAVETNQLENVKNDMDLVASVVESSRDLLLVFRSPLVSVHKKTNIINELFKDKISELALKFLILITRKGRIVCLDTIADTYLDMYKEKNNIKTVYFETASKIDSKIKEKITEVMAKHTNKSIELSPEINPRIIGGFRIRFDDYIYDASLKKKLVLLRKEFEKNIYERKF